MPVSVNDAYTEQHNHWTPEWPGSADGTCPFCGYLGDDEWKFEFHVGRTSKPSPTGIEWVEWIAKPGEEVLIAMTCPSCKTRWKTADLPP